MDQALHHPTQQALQDLFRSHDIETLRQLNQLSAIRFAELAEEYGKPE